MHLTPKRSPKRMFLHKKLLPIKDIATLDKSFSFPKKHKQNTFQNEVCRKYKNIRIVSGFIRINYDQKLFLNTICLITSNTSSTNSVNHQD